MRQPPRTSPPPPPAWEWTARLDRVVVQFRGRGGAGSPTELAGQLEAGPQELAWLEQIHSARVRTARPGCAGEGDALVTDRADLGLVVATADCVPVLLAAPGWIAAVHAGWRGLVAGVIGAALERLPAGVDVEAWIGPAIGSCCYEVGEDVAARVVAASGAEIVAPGPRGRPHLDLPGAAAHQLAAHGVTRLHRVGRCTRCASEHLWSYRRDGADAGRNWAVIWRRGQL